MDGGGCCRLALTDADKQARDLFVGWCRDAGCGVQNDPYGNIFAFRRGIDLNAPIVLTGSHLDTQPHGWHLDGVYGVLAWLEVVRALNDVRIETLATIAVVNWTNEESVRYAPGLSGSSAFTGKLSRNEALSIVGTDGSVYGDELLRIGSAGELDPDSLKIRAHVEAHIEQGPVLERLGKSIGAVSGIQGVRWFEVTIGGANRHSGTTPMLDRQDGFMAAARYGLDMRSFALETHPDVRFTIGRARIEPGSPNTLPGRTVFAIDLRHQDEAVLDRIEAFLKASRGLAAEENVRVSVRSFMVAPPVRFYDECVSAVIRAAAAQGEQYASMISGALHDAGRLAAVAPTGMIFVPPREGISHHGDEWTNPEQLTVGCEVLAETLLDLAGVLKSPQRRAAED